MAFTYIAGSTQNRDRIRARIGDTDSSAAITQRLEDEEIADFLTTEGGFRSAASACARALAAKFLRVATDKSMGNLRLVWQARHEALIALAKELQAGGALTVLPLAGGMSLDEKQSAAEDEDLVQPLFRREQFDHVAVSHEGPLSEKAE